MEVFETLSPSDIDPSWLRGHECGPTVGLVGKQVKVLKLWYSVGKGPNGQNCAYLEGGGYINIYPEYGNSPDSLWEVGATYKVKGHLTYVSQGMLMEYGGTTVFLEKVKEVETPWDIVHPNPPIPDKDGWFYFTYPKNGYPSGGFMDNTVLLKYKENPKFNVAKYQLKYIGKSLLMTANQWMMFPGANKLPSESSLGSNWKNITPELAGQMEQKWKEKDWASLKGPTHSKVMASKNPSTSLICESGYKPYPKTDLEFLLD